MSSKGILFSEIQQFKYAWVWIVLALLIILSFGLMILYYKEGFLRDESTSLTELYITGGILSVLFIGLFFLFNSMKLDVQINHEGIEFKFPPFISKRKRIASGLIQKYEVRTYKPIKEYGGWGFRQSTKKGKIAYNVKGNVGLQLFLSDGRNILLGTQREEAIKYAMNKMMEGR